MPPGAGPTTNLSTHTSCRLCIALIDINLQYGLDYRSNNNNKWHDIHTVCHTWSLVIHVYIYIWIRRPLYFFTEYHHLNRVQIIYDDI